MNCCVYARTTHCILINWFSARMRLTFIKSSDKCVDARANANTNDVSPFCFPYILWT